MSAVQRKASVNALPHRNNDDDHSDIFSAMHAYDYGEVHFKKDEQTGLQAIVAIHSTRRGPSLGGCRFKDYATTDEALKDVMRLAQAMSYKAAIADLPLGGGKSVILKSPTITNRVKLFESFGTFVNDLGGRYITALDSGTVEEDMNVIARKTNYVASQSQPGGISGNPAPSTALGVFKGIQAAVKYKLGKDELKDLHVVIQGVGQVGHALAGLLHERGAKLTVCDVDEKRVQQCVIEFQATPVDIYSAHKIACDVFAPSALGGIINDTTLRQLNTPIIAGCANNQLEEPRHGLALYQQGILYAPDYLINAGGLIYAASLYLKMSPTELHKKIDGIYSRLLEVFTRSEQEHRPTNEIVDAMAKQLIS